MGPEYCSYASRAHKELRDPEYSDLGMWASLKGGLQSNVCMHPGNESSPSICQNQGDQWRGTTGRDFCKGDLASVWMLFDTV